MDRKRARAGVWPDLARRSRAVVVLSALLALLLGESASGQSAETAERARIAFAEGRYEEAIEDWTRALEEVSEGDRATVLLSRAEAYQALGYLPRAVADLEAALDGARAAGGEALTARLQGALGNALFLSGRTERAAAAFERCLAIAVRIGDGQLEARTWNNIGNLLAASATTGEPGALARRFALDAGGAYERSHRLALASGDPALAADALLNAVHVAPERALTENAEERLAQALALYRTVPGSASVAGGLVAGARLVLRRARRPLAPALRDLVRAAVADAEALSRRQSDRRTLSHALGYRGQLHEMAGDDEQALALSREALFLAQQANAPDIAYLWQWQIGRIVESRGDLEGARASYEQAVETLRAMRADRVIGPGGSLVDDETRDVYLDLVDLLLRRSDRQPNARLAQADLVDARRTMELLKTTELEDYYRDDCVADLQAKRTPIDDVIVDAAALYPIPLAERTELLLTLPGGMTRVTVPVGAAELNEQVLLFRQLLEKRTRQYLRPARKLYDWLIRPIEPALEQAGVDTLVFVPAGALRTVPIAPLHDGERHLVERYASVVAPGLTLLDPRPLSRQAIEPLVSGLSASVQGFEPLPHVGLELDSVQSLLGGDVIRDRDFRSERVARALADKPYSIVHVASHAQFKADARESYLLTYDGRLTMDDLESFVKLSQFRDEPVELLTLSACATAAGDERAALGLAGVAVKAGARSAVASLWFVNDQASADLVAQLYHNLGRPGASKARALREAQLTLMNDKRYRYPVYWASFLLIGNWL